MFATDHLAFATRCLDRLAKRFLEQGLEMAEFRLMVGHAKSIARRTGETTDAVLGAYGISLA